MATNFIPSFGDLDRLASGDKANDTLEAYDGYRRWDGDAEASMLGFVYVFTLGFAALHSRIVKMFVYGVNQKLKESLENAHKLHGQMTIVTLCSIAKEHKFTVKHVKNVNNGSRMNYWIWLKNVD